MLLTLFSFLYVSEVLQRDLFEVEDGDGELESADASTQTSSLGHDRICQTESPQLVNRICQTESPQLVNRICLTESPQLVKTRGVSMNVSPVGSDEASTQTSFQEVRPAEPKPPASKDGQCQTEGVMMSGKLVFFLSLHDY